MSAPATPIRESQNEFFLSHLSNGLPDSSSSNLDSPGSDGREVENEQDAINSRSSAGFPNMPTEFHTEQQDTSLDVVSDLSIKSPSRSTILLEDEEAMIGELNHNTNNRLVASPDAVSYSSIKSPSRSTILSEDEEAAVDELNHNNSSNLIASPSQNRDSKPPSTGVHTQKLLPDSPRSQSPLRSKTSSSTKNLLHVNRSDLPLSPSSSLHSSRSYSIEFTTDQSLSNNNFNSTSTPTLMKLQHRESESTIKATPALSDATELVSPLVKPKDESEVNLNSVSSLENFRSSQYDSLKSPRFELGELEDFIPDLHLHNAKAKSDNAVRDDASLPDKKLADENVLHKSIGVSNDKNNDSLPTIGVKKEQSVIDSLKQENFRLQLRVVFMENHMNSTSTAGVAELRSKLAESEANRLATKNENDRLRQTIASLDNEEVSEEKERIKAHIQHMQDEVSMYEHERIEFEQERAEWKQKEDEIKVSKFHCFQLLSLLTFDRHSMKRNCTTKRWRCSILLKRMKSFSIV